MEVRQRLGDRNPLVQRLLQLIGGADDIQHHEGVQEDANAVGQPAAEEAQDEDDCGLQSPLLQRLALGAFGQLGDDDAVADEDNKTRQDEAHQDVLEAENDGPHHSTLHRVEALTDRPGVLHLYAVVPEAEAGGWDALDPGEHQVGYSEEGGGQPHAHVDHPARQQLSGGLAVGGPDDGQVSVQADEGQDQHAAVQVDGVDHMRRHADEASEVPGFHSIHRPEGQSED